MENLEQTFILFFSGLSVCFFASKNEKKRFIGFILALCGQPLWWHTSWVNGQWGVFILSLWYSLNHIRGIWNNRQ